MRVLVCGDRHWNDAMKIFDVLTGLKDQYGRFTVVQGGANGADALAGQVALTLRLGCEVYPADWKKYGRRAGPIRNRQMLDTRPDLVLAFHDDLEHSRGTKDCVSEATRRGIRVRIITHRS